MNDGQWDAVRRRSAQIEAVDGWDSLGTMETKYPATESGAILCPFPTCGFARFDARAMFKHVHFGPHGLTWRMSLEDFAAGEVKP